jgi:putative ABC transport system permease protein
MRFWELIRQSAEAIARARTRSLLTTFGIAIAAGAMVCMVAFALGLQAQIEAPFKLLGLLNHIQVLPGPLADNGKPGRPLDDEAIKAIEALPEVDYAFPDIRISEVRATNGDKTKRVFAIGLPREPALFSYFRDFLVTGEFFSISHQPEAILGEQLVSMLGFKSPEDAVGHTLHLAVSGLASLGGDKFHVQQKTLDVKIVAVYRPPSFATQIGADAMVLPVDLMRDMPGANIESTLHRMRVQPGSTPSPYAQVMAHVVRIGDVPRAEKEIRALGFETHSFLDQLAQVRKSFLFMEVLLASVGTVALIVAGLGIANTLLMTVMERSQEIGLYKAIGASDGDVRMLFLTEAGVLGFVGGLVGLVLAWVVAMILQWGINVYAAHQGIPQPGSVFRFPLWLLASAVLFAVVVSVLSGLYPASRAARQDPIRALRGQ